MWIMTPRGFYSAVEKGGDNAAGMLTIRARSKQDLLNLSDILPVAPYREQRWSDYPWRIRVTAAEWMKICAVLASEIDYSNFKDEVKRRQGPRRASVYSRVWGALLSIEQEPKAMVPRTYTQTAIDWPDDASRIDSRELLDTRARADRERTRKAPPRKRRGKGKDA